MSKIYLSDGFYRLFLRPEDTHRLTVLFPLRPNEPDLIGIPLRNPMGWVSSPPNFSACTKTIADLANTDLSDPHAMARAWCAPHQFDVLSESNPENELATPTISARDLDPLDVGGTPTLGYLGQPQFWLFQGAPPTLPPPILRFRGSPQYQFT